MKSVCVIGGGAAGLTAAIYCGRAKLNTLVIEKTLVGGLATYTNEIENYPGFPEGATGLGLMDLFHKQAKKFGVKFKLTDFLTFFKNLNKLFIILFFFKNLLFVNSSQHHMVYSAFGFFSCCSWHFYHP